MPYIKGCANQEAVMHHAFLRTFPAKKEGPGRQKGREEKAEIVLTSTGSVKSVVLVTRRIRVF